MKRALVLSGGGSRGAYQFGVWKALRKLHKRIDIVTGTSIGALNGCLMVQNDYKKAELLWNNLSFSSVFDKEIDINTFKGKTDLFKEYLKAFLEEGGMDVSNLEKTVSDNINLDKFYKSKIDFGLVTFKLNTLTPILLEKKDIKKKYLADYLIASATCYPAFKTKEIDSDIYIDGGYYDNLPINLAVDMGAKEVVAVDLSTLGVIRKIKDNNISVKYIKPRNKLGNFLVFDANEAKRAINLGYNDTMKEFNKLVGKKYTFYKLGFYINRFIYESRFNKNIIKLNNPKTKLGLILKTNIYKDLLLGNNKDSLLEVLDSIGEVFNLPDDKVYHMFNYNFELIKRLKDTPSISKDSIMNIIKDKKINKLLDSTTLVKYIYENINKKQDVVNLGSLFSKEYKIAIYLYTIKKHI